MTALKKGEIEWVKRLEMGKTDNCSFMPGIVLRAGYTVLSQVW